MPFAIAPIGSGGGGSSGVSGGIATPGKPGQPRFTGNGAPPSSMPGIEAGDVYMDLTTGQLYKWV